MLPPLSVEEELLHLAPPTWIWIVFHVIIITGIIIDLLGFQKKVHKPSFKESLTWVVVWVSVGISFGLLVMYLYGVLIGAVFYTAYMIEYMMSFDNLFVFLVIFNYFAVPYEYQHKTLYIGILSAILFRGLFIFAGVWLLEQFEWMTYVFGIILIISGARLGTGGEEKVEPERNPVVRYARKALPLTRSYVGNKFIVRNAGKLFFTPLIVVLLAIETTDVIFAFDSVPTVIALTENFFIAYTSNIMAVLGLRALYFVLAVIMYEFKYVSKGLAIILIYLGIKMIGAELGFNIPLFASILVIILILIASIILSIVIVEEEVKEPAAKEGATG